MAIIFQTIFSNTFSWMKMYKFLLKVHWSFFLGSNYQYSNIGSDNGLAPIRQQVIIWTKHGIVYWRIYMQCRRKTFMVNQTFVWWTLCILYKFVKYPIRHLGLAIGNVRCVRRISPTLYMHHSVWYKTKVGSHNFGHQHWWPFVGLPKLIAHISSQFQHLVSTVLAAGSLVKMHTNKVAYTSKMKEIHVVYSSLTGISWN